MSAFDRIADAVASLSSSTRAPLDVLASRAGMSPFHFQRTFTRLVGVSPLRFQQVVRVDAAREALRRSQSVLDAALEAGLSGPGRLHDDFLRIERMTPGEFKRGLEISWCTVKTELGDVAIAATRRGVCGVSFTDGGDPVDVLSARWPATTLTRAPKPLAAAAEALRRALGGERPGAPLSVVLAGTQLQVAVWEALVRLPRGTVASYAQVARLAGHAAAVRAVAGAVANNPIACLIPCHRVIQSTGVLGEYRWGAARKAALLSRELASAPAAQG